MAHSGLPAIGFSETMREAKPVEIRNFTEHPYATLFRLRSNCLRGRIISRVPF